MDKSCAVLLAFFVCYGGMLGLCLAMNRHHAQVFRRPPGRLLGRGLRLGGWMLLGLALWLCGLAWGWAIGPVAWFGLLSAAALGLVFLLPHAPRLAAWLAVAGPVVALPTFLL